MQGWRSDKLEMTLEIEILLDRGLACLNHRGHLDKWALTRTLLSWFRLEVEAAIVLRLTALGLNLNMSPDTLATLPISALEAVATSNLRVVIFASHRLAIALSIIHHKTNYY